MFLGEKKTFKIRVRSNTHLSILDIVFSFNTYKLVYIGTGVVHYLPRSPLKSDAFFSPFLYYILRFSSKNPIFIVRIKK